MEIQAGLAKNLENRGYKQVHTRALTPCPGSDPEIEHISASYRPLMQTPPGPCELYLHTSPEFEMKRLIAAGHEAIYQVCSAYRQGELSRLHSPEFTVAEWYRTGITWLELCREVEQVVSEVLEGKALASGREMRIEPPFQRMRVKDALEAAGADPDSWTGLPEAEWRAAFYRAQAERLMPWLEKKGAVILTHFPPPAAVLAKLNNEDPPAAERFEVVIAGMEIANGATEITDPREYRARFSADAEVRKKSGKKVLPLPGPFLKDIERKGMPDCAGVALGVERLAMLATGAESIEHVMASPFAG